MADAESLKNKVVDRLEQGRECEAEMRAFLAAAGHRATLVFPPFTCMCLGNRHAGNKETPLALRALLEAKADPNVLDPNTKNPVLHTACWHGAIESVRLLSSLNKAEVPLKMYGQARERRETL